ncbi:MAG TPA: Crp/Fnr family transcriptional regulator [Baekduia sp.]|uniref:Crp/Fnr family transcriptional regulator n=1 Tax=Baekduia sp. TaxID=2600305 RepID=UPI002D79C585|nr:Crp/Fnr family transcriptional regulator [Baekduia sp.]HET6505427.1 Crp/Fnr family transcriptional regulator [Baekduia sp.]
MTSTGPGRPLVRLLDVEPELAARLREDDRAEARERLRLSRLDLPAGEQWPAPGARRGGAFGVFVLDGLLLEETRIAGRRTQQLLGAGDVALLAPVDAPGSLDVDLRLVAATECVVALLDDRLQAPFALWPGLALGLLERAGRRLARSAAQVAIAQMPRVEDRLEATFWDLADRWGRVTPSGIHIPLQLTHQTLARIVGGRRPTISLALTALAERGIVTRLRDGSWLLVARTPTLAPNDAAPAPMAPIARTPEHPKAPVVAVAWLPQARDELLATTRRIGSEHAATARRVAADHARYEQTRRASEALRRRTARERREREADRGTWVIPGRAPAAPSGG